MEQKYNMLAISLNSIVPHLEYDKYTELLSIIDYAIPNSLVQDMAMNILQLIHPVVVIRGWRKRFICIGGLRTLSLAKTKLDATAEIQVLLIKHPATYIINMMILTDILVTPLLYSVRSPRSFGDLFSVVPQADIARLLSKKSNTRCGFTKEIGYAYNTIFPHKRKE